MVEGVGAPRGVLFRPCRPKPGWRAGSAPLVFGAAVLVLVRAFGAVLVREGRAEEEEAPGAVAVVSVGRPALPAGVAADVRRVFEGCTGSGVISELNRPWLVGGAAAVFVVVLGAGGCTGAGVISLVRP